MRELIWGSWNVICDRCGFKYKSFQLRKEWTGLMVCKNCWEPRHPQDLIKIPKDDQSVPWSRPEPDDVFIDVNYGKYLYIPGRTNNYALTPDSIANSIIGDIDIRTKVSMDNWVPASTNYFASKYNNGTQNSWLFAIGTTGKLRFQWSPDGTVGALITKDSTIALTVFSGQTLWVRATLDVDNGVGGSDLKFYTSVDGVIWTKLGATVTTAGVTSIFDSTTGVEIGGFAAGQGITVVRQQYYMDIRNVIDGTIPVVKFDPSNDAIDFSTTFTSSTGEVWTINQNGTPFAELKYTNLEDPIPSGNFTTNNGTL